jgi:hypothetical protein
MQLDTTIRSALVATIRTGLHEAVAGSDVLLRGSLAAGRADAYSDIDLLWEVPDPLFRSSVERLPVILSRVRPIASLRADLDYQRSDRRRLVYVRFRDVPLFWRVDFDILARSLNRDLQYDADNPAARDAEWSWTASALANAVGAVKWHLRQRDDEALALLQRAYQRVGLRMADGGVPTLVLDLATRIAATDPAVAPFADEIVRLVEDAC